MKLLSFVVILASAAVGQMLPPVGFGLNIQTTGMVGIAEGQAARLNVLNPGVQAPAATGALCSGLLSFIDDQGGILKSLTVTVAPGKAIFLDLDSDADLHLEVNGRKQIRATVQVPPAAPTPGAIATGFCTLAPTLEIFDKSSGKTQVILTGTRMIPQLIMQGPVLP